MKASVDQIDLGQFGAIYWRKSVNAHLKKAGSSKVHDAGSILRISSDYFIMNFNFAKTRQLEFDGLILKLVFETS